MSRKLARKSQATPPLSEMVEHIQTREDFVAFAHAFLKNLHEQPEGWENGNLPSFLQALTTWVEDMYGYYQNKGEPLPLQPSWKILGQILLAAKVYE